VLLDRLRAPHPISWFPEIVRETGPDYFSGQSRIKHVAITESHDLAARVRRILNYRPHIDAKQDVDWTIFNYNSIISQATEVTARELFDVARFGAVHDDCASACRIADVGALHVRVCDA
jgi:hypothetical protein